MKTKLESLKEEKASAVAREDFKEAKRLKGAIGQLEQRLNPKPKIMEGVEGMLKDSKKREQVSDALKNPQMQEMLQEAINDPEVLENIPGMKDMAGMDNFKEMMKNPEFLSMMADTLKDPSDMEKVLKFVQNPEMLKTLGKGMPEL